MFLLLFFIIGSGIRLSDRCFLLELRHNPASQRKPEGLSNLEVVRDKVSRCSSCFSLVYGSVGLFLVMMIAIDPLIDECRFHLTA